MDLTMEMYCMLINLFLKYFAVLIFLLIIHKLRQSTECMHTVYGIFFFTVQVFVSIFIYSTLSRGFLLNPPKMKMPLFYSSGIAEKRHLPIFIKLTKSQLLFC